jgi:hypothetical protein
MRTHIARRESSMTIAVFVVLVVFSGLAVVGYALFELTPFARHPSARE